MSELEEAWREYREAVAARDAAWRRYEALRATHERRIRIPTVAPPKPKQKREKQPKREPIPEFRI